MDCRVKPGNDDSSDDDGARHLILQLESLSKAFGSVVVADNIDLQLNEGTSLGIIGPNGAGKSSLFNLIAGALKPDSGTIRLGGADVTATPPQARARAGIARSFQIPQPFGNLTVFENLLVGATHCSGRPVAEVAERCGAVLEQTGLLPLANRRAGTLTLLERKRLELARALATEPRLLLLDEIAGGLTDAECEVLVGTIRDIRASGVTIVWIEHIVHALIAVVERLLVLNFGRKVADGEPRAVIASPQVREIYLGIEA
jgi:branched-chain amino acid transport system ATP-binding protein